MRYTLYIILALAGIANLFTACSKVEETVQPESEYGYFSLDLEVTQPNLSVITKAMGVDVNQFSVVITGKDNGYKKEFATFQELKEGGTLRLEKGNYTVAVSSEKTQMPEVATTPFYAGNKDLTIQANFFSKCEVTCLMQQVRVKVKLEKELMDALTGVGVCLTNGNAGGSHNFTLSPTGESDEIYIKPTDALRLSFTAIEKEYQEPISYNELLKYKDERFPVANDYVTVTIGLATDGTKALSTRSADRAFTIKMTVQ